MRPTEGFAVIGCPKCRRILAADLSYETKTCQCGHKISLHSARFLRLCPSGEDAAQAVRDLQKQRNTGFTSAAAIADAEKNGLAGGLDTTDAE